MIPSKRDSSRAASAPTTTIPPSGRQRTAAASTSWPSLSNTAETSTGRPRVAFAGHSPDAVLGCSSTMSMWSKRLDRDGTRRGYRRADGLPVRVRADDAVVRTIVLLRTGATPYGAVRPRFPSVPAYFGAFERHWHDGSAQRCDNPTSIQARATASHR